MNKRLSLVFLGLALAACAPSTTAPAKKEPLPVITVTDKRTYASTCAQVAANVRAAAPSARPTPLIRAGLWSTLIESSSEGYNLTYLSKNNLAKDELLKTVASCKQTMTKTALVSELTLTSTGAVTEADLHAMHSFILDEIKLPRS